MLESGRDTRGEATQFRQAGLLPEHDSYWSAHLVHGLPTTSPQAWDAPLVAARHASLVLLTHVDESYTKERYFLAALRVPENEANSITGALNGVVMDAAIDHRKASAVNRLFTAENWYS